MDRHTEAFRYVTFSRFTLIFGAAIAFLGVLMFAFAILDVVVGVMSFSQPDVGKWVTTGKWCFVLATPVLVTGGIASVRGDLAKQVLSVPGVR